MNRNYHGSRAAKKNPAPKRFALLLALVLILVGTVGGTVAYLVTHTAPVKNTFTPGNVTCDVVEGFNTEKTAKTSVKVQNTGNVPAYIRVAVVANNVGKDDEGNTVILPGTPNLGNVFDTTNWTAGADGFYYYKGVVQPDEVTDGNLLKSGIALNGIQVTILASAIQSAPAKAVNEAWGMDYSNNVWVSYTSGN